MVQKSQVFKKPELNVQKLWVQIIGSLQTIQVSWPQMGIANTLCDMIQHITRTTVFVVVSRHYADRKKGTLMDAIQTIPITRQDPIENRVPYG